MLTDKRVLVTGGTGSLGQALVRRLLGASWGCPARSWSSRATRPSSTRCGSRTSTGASRPTRSSTTRSATAGCTSASATCATTRRSSALLRDADVVFHAAAMKQVPTCEYFPVEAVHTNVDGAQNIVRAIRERGCRSRPSSAISTDKACKPVNVMGMTKAIQERILIDAEPALRATRFVVVRYGNVIASRGSVVPLFLEQIAPRRAGHRHHAGDDPLPAHPRPGGRHRLRGAALAARRARPTSRAARGRGSSTWRGR